MGSIEITDTGGGVFAGSTPHYHSDVLRGNTIAQRFHPLPMSNKEVYHEVGVLEY